MIYNVFVGTLNLAQSIMYVQNTKMKGVEMTTGKMTYISVHITAIAVE